MLTGIQHKLVHMQETGELSRQQKTITQRSITHMLRPQPVKGVTSLPQGMEPSTHSFDPSVIINRDIVDTKGHVIAEKGQSLNPLNESSFGETFVFIDGDSPSQVSWIKKKIEARGEYVKPLRVILTNGDVKATSEELGRRVYFDQRGYLCKHFSITHVPVVVFQPGTEKRLLVQEVKLG
jgi:conjugal transfer pilus assembly protein TraW